MRQLLVSIHWFLLDVEGGYIMPMHITSLHISPFQKGFRPSKGSVLVLSTVSES